MQDVVEEEVVRDVGELNSEVIPEGCEPGRGGPVRGKGLESVLVFGYSAILLCDGEGKGSRWLRSFHEEYVMFYRDLSGMLTWKIW